MARFDTVSCSNGFLWEEHIPFFVVFMLTKFVELHYYANDPTLQGALGVTTFLIKFLPSTLGYIDGYSDAMSIAIAASCPGELAQTLSYLMAGEFLIGVVLLQWVVLAYLAVQDPSHSCIMKLLHMDSLAACVSLPEESRSTWRWINFARTFGEDIPQAILQSIFLVYVKRNPIMLLSVVIGVITSTKALLEAIKRRLV